MKANNTPGGMTLGHGTVDANNWSDVAPHVPGSERDGARANVSTAQPLRPSIASTRQLSKVLRTKQQMPVLPTSADPLWNLISGS